MPDMDSSQVRLLASRLAFAPARVAPALLPVAHRAGNNLKRTLRTDASGHRRLGGLAAGISYEVDATPTSVSVSAGWFAPTGQGHLENIAVYGTARSAPLLDITRGPREEAPKFGAYLAQAAAKALL